MIQSQWIVNWSDHQGSDQVINGVSAELSMELVTTMQKSETKFELMRKLLGICYLRNLQTKDQDHRPPTKTTAR
mgnify:CR=1 FL=1